MEERRGTMMQLPFNLGVKCMEQSVVEIDEAVRHFASNSGNPNPLNLYSWKFPHLKLEKIEVGTILRNLRDQALTGDTHYLHLTELLIDRLYFSVLSSIRCVSMLTDVANSGGSRPSSSREMGPGGDFLGLGVVNPLCSDSKVFNTNMALVIRHFQSLLTDLEGVVTQIVIKLRKFELTTPEYDDRSSEYAYRSGPTARAVKSCVTQTRITSIECCEVCSLCQEAIKKVGETLESCVLGISPKEQTAVGAARIDITKNVCGSTQWSAVTRWCEALTTDADTIRRQTFENLKRYADLDQELKKTLHLLNTNTRDHQLAMQKLERKCTTLEAQLQVRKKEKADARELQHSLEEKVGYLEQKLGRRVEELKKESAEKESLKQTLSVLEKSHQELKYSQTTHSQTLRRIQQDLLAEQKYKETVQGNLLALEGSNRKYRLEIAKLRSDLGLLTSEKTKLEKEVNGVKAELLKAVDKAKDQKIAEIGGLKKELKVAEQKIELLTLYPDLNGPINTPESENEDVVKTMEKQLQGNTMRVQVLLQQTEKLASTLKKLKGQKN